MDLQNLAGIIPTRLNCFALLELLESTYQVDLDFWLRISKPAGGEVQTRVFASGSGFIYDQCPGLGDNLSTLVLESQGGNLYAALWSLLCQLEAEYRRVDCPILPARLP